MRCLYVDCTNLFIGARFMANALSKPVDWFCIMCKPRLKCSLRSLARLSRDIYCGFSIFISVMCLVYLVEYTLNPNSIIEIAPES